MTSNVRRAAAFVAVGALSLLAPAATGRLSPLPATAVATLPFVAVAGTALYAVDDGRLFGLLARPGDYEERRLYGLAGFALAAAGLAILATRFGLPVETFVAGVAVLAAGNLAKEAVRAAVDSVDPFVATTGFAVGGTLAGAAGFLGGKAVATGSLATTGDVEPVLFLAASGALFAALLRSMLFERDDPLVLLSVTLFLWGLVELDPAVAPDRVLVGLAVSVFFGYVAYKLETASLQGMLTGVLLAFLAVVLGGYGWFALLITFFGIGGLSSKFRYEQKRERGIAEDNEGARGSGNVLANAAVALVAVLAFAASERAGVPPALFLFAYAGSVATAMADTLSSEIGGLYNGPRLVTTLERVEPGTDGAVTWQGELAGLAGAGVIAGIAAVAFDLGPTATLVVLAGGFVGMTVDSILGATLEGGALGNQSVNLLATLGGAVAGALLAVAVGAVRLSLSMSLPLPLPL
ncbi:DUF92 domain-containing protein [Halobacteriales archaeon QS_5_70_15]|nr:MAG: DUF92 domain-containing protein [Halobacteriales archaeon QS_5_70_15]